MDKFLKSMCECSKVNYNLDCDGICSYLLLKKAFPYVGFGGFTNSDEIILSTNKNDWKDISTLFMDIFLSDDRLWSLDQHIYLKKGAQDNYERKINPNGEIAQIYACDGSYTSKYPFSTAHFVLAALEKNDLFDTELPFNKVIDKMSTDKLEITFGDLFLNLDGVLNNYLKYNENVKLWAKRLVDYSNNGKNTVNMMKYLFSKNPKEFIEKDLAIRVFYAKYGLDVDGGFSPSKSTQENIALTEKLKRSFNKYIGAPIGSSNFKLYEYVGKSELVVVDEEDAMPKCDTFAYVGQNKLSYTNGITNRGKEYEVRLYV